MSENKKIIFRKATIADADFITKRILEDPDKSDTEESIVLLKKIIETRGTDFSYDAAYIILYEGIEVGIAIVYPGEEYQERRDKTKSMVPKEMAEELEYSEPEVFPGQFFLNMLVIKEEYRGRGLYKKIFEEVICLAKEKGYSYLACVVDCQKEQLIEYYKKHGMKLNGEVTVWGEKHIRMFYNVLNQEN